MDARELGQWLKPIRAVEDVAEGTVEVEDDTQEVALFTRTYSKLTMSNLKK